MLRKFYISLTIVASIIALFACKNNPDKKLKEKEQLIIFHAGSLSVPFRQISEEFRKENPNVEILLESAGSRACARKITDLNRECDIMISADYTVIDNLLIPDHTTWNIRFASNEMTIVYHETSKYADEINQKNWYEILMQDDVIFGRSDPESDPCGYRAVLTSKLAENHYKLDGFATKFFTKDVNYIRPKEVDLLALLESNTIAYNFLYRSVAQQHGLKYLLLPDEINLKNTGLAEIYAQVTIDLTGKKPGEKITKKGEPMVYGLTILENAPHKELALKFVDFLLNKEKGMKIMEENGQPSIIPSVSENYDAIPEQLKKYTSK